MLRVITLGTLDVIDDHVTGSRPSEIDPVVHYRGRRQRVNPRATVMSTEEEKAKIARLSELASKSVRARRRLPRRPRASSVTPVLKIDSWGAQISSHAHLPSSDPRPSTFAAIRVRRRAMGRRARDVRRASIVARVPDSQERQGRRGADAGARVRGAETAESGGQARATVGGVAAPLVRSRAPSQLLDARRRDGRTRSAVLDRLGVRLGHAHVDAVGVHEHLGRSLLRRAPRPPPRRARADVFLVVVAI